jgi:hypothetical protein
LLRNQRYEKNTNRLEVITLTFLDPNKPLATCQAENCRDCRVSKTLHCHFNAMDLAQFYAIVLPSFFLGGAAIYRFGSGFLVPWLVIILGFFGLVEIRVMCSHCPHYAEPGRTLKCWANHGSPKLWKFRPGPMSGLEKGLLSGGFAAVWGYPLAFLLAGPQWFLLIVYVVSSAGFFFALKRFLCSQCINFACPLNGVDDAARQAFFARNPTIAGAWRGDGE